MPSWTASNAFSPEADGSRTKSSDALSTPSASRRLPFALLNVFHEFRSVGAGAETSSAAPSPKAEASQRTENMGDVRDTPAMCPR